MGSPLNKLARKGRAERAAARSSGRERRHEDPDAPSNILARSIRSPLELWQGLLTVAGSIGCAGLIVGLGGFGPASLAAGGAVLIVGTWLSVRLASWATEREIQWLRSLPFAFDVEAYRSAMTRKEFYGTLRLTVTFAKHETDLEAGYRGGPGRLDLSTETLTDALSAAKGARACADGVRRFKVESPRFDTWFVGDDSAHSNHKLHLWFRSYTKKVLLALHSERAIERVSVELH